MWIVQGFCCSWLNRRKPVRKRAIQLSGAWPGKDDKEDGALSVTTGRYQFFSPKSPSA